MPPNPRRKKIGILIIILQQLLHSEEDPYSREHLTKELLETHNMKECVKSRIDELKLKIDKWLHK